MNKRQILISGKEPRQKVAIVLCLLSQFLLGILLSGAAFAQDTETRVTTLLPTLNECKEWDSSEKTWKTAALKTREGNPILAVWDAFTSDTKKKICYLEFSAESIPDKATITSAVLRIVQKGDQPNSKPLVINVASIPKGDWTKNLADYTDQKKNFLGVVRSDTAESDTVDAFNHVAGTSRFPLPSEANKKYLALLLSPAASRSGRNYYPATGDTSNTASKQPRLILTYTVPRLSTPRSPVSQSDGWAAMRSPRPFMPAPNVPAQDQYTAIPIGEGANLRFKDVPDKLGNKTLLAPDGTRYLIGDTDLSALNPDGQMLWKMGIGNSDDARMTLSPDGQFVYATALLPDGNSKKPTFLAINAQTGKAVSIDLPPDTKTFHKPVVIKHPDGADYIYIAANSGSNGVLGTVKNKPSEKPGDHIAELTRVGEEKGLFSQPAPDSAVLPARGDLMKKKLYVLWKENNAVRLVSVNGQNGSIENRDAPTIENSQSAFADGSWLWKSGNLAMDASDNVFFWENGTLYGYQTKPAASKLFAWMQATGSGGSPPPGLSEQLELLFGSDGTLFAQESKTGAAFALIPTYHLPTAEASISSPTNLRVDGTVTTSNTVRAQGSVFLGNGFTVSKNGTFKIKKPYPWLPADVVGTYRHEPRENDWHEGTIRFRGDNLVWENKAGSSWNLIPDPENGDLKTDSTNPYFAQSNKRVFKIEVRDGRVEDFLFGTASYKRVRGD